MGYVKWSYETLNHFCGDVFKAFGFTEEESNQIKDVLLTADLYRQTEVNRQQKRSALFRQLLYFVIQNRKNLN